MSPSSSTTQHTYSPATLNLLSRDTHGRRQLELFTGRSPASKPQPNTLFFSDVGSADVTPTPPDLISLSLSLSRTSWRGDEVKGKRRKRRRYEREGDGGTAAVGERRWWCLG
ncbi:hypothetical protein Hanom_Chr16g01427541 [Helianthus anomalus]